MSILVKAAYKNQEVFYAAEYRPPEGQFVKEKKAHSQDPSATLKVR